MEDAVARIGTALADRYLIEREVGRGGMATVHLATDLRHHRRVAIKLLRPELAAALGAERFLREIEIAARLHHPHILPLYDSGEVQGQLYYVMPFIEEEPLRERLRREMQLAVEEAVRIAGEVAEGLGCAHSQGVVHRDVKPENILFSGGHAVVADFGIARAISGAEGKLTGTGLSVGTPAYMSPEQSSGEVDARSDIYSLGCVLYEMLVGQPPFSGRSTQAVMARHAVDPVPSIRTVRATVPEVLERAIVKALAKVPADRFATATDFAEAIRRLERRAVRVSAAPPAAPPRHAVAVLPFANISADPENEWISDGLTEELITAMARIAGLRVASRISAFAFKGKAADVRTVGERLNVGTVIEGSVRKIGQSLRITAQLTSATDGLSLWSATFEREMRDVFALQEEISRAIVEELRPTLAGRVPSAPLIQRPTDNVEAYHAYWRGRYFWNQRTPQGLQKALQCYADALALDPGYARAYAGMADAYIALAQFQYLPPREVFPKAEAAARRALELDPMLAEAHTSLAHILEVFHWRWGDAEQEYRRALELDPSYATAHAWLADCLMAQGRTEESFAEIARAQQLEPLSVPIEFQAATLLYRARRFDEAIAEYRRVIEMAPTYAVAYVFLAIALAHSSQFAEAVALLERAQAAVGPRPVIHMALGYTYGLEGRTEEASGIVEQLRARAAQEYVPAAFIALVYIALRRFDEAFEWLEKAFADHSILMTMLQVDPLLDPVRGDARFEALVRKVFR
ncbi:MAG: protein kinase domain-containing protein [Candidatus Rokuibacteriota bacterium]